MLSLADVDWNSRSNRDMAYANIQYSLTDEEAFISGIRTMDSR